MFSRSQQRKKWKYILPVKGKQSTANPRFKPEFDRQDVCPSSRLDFCSSWPKLDEYVVILYFSTDELKLWSCKISEISQSNLNINLIKQLTEKSKFNKIRKSMNSAQKSPNPNSQRQRLKVNMTRVIRRIRSFSKTVRSLG